MSDFIEGTNFVYKIDTNYNSNKDGFIAEGTESIVFKGIKESGSLVYSCVLKFKPRSRLDDFNNREYEILKAMQTCRSVVRILDVIKDIGDFNIPIPNNPEGKCIVNEDYFCVVEEYIDGYSLQDFCINQWFVYDDNSKIWKRNTREYNYTEVVKYQNQLIQFMYNLCEIMKFISSEHREMSLRGVLHCDIKPENIMVTKNGNELVLIDFGRSQELSSDNNYQHFSDSNEKIFSADYNVRNWEKLEKGNKDNIYAYGTVGYAAPECYAGQDPSFLGEKAFPFKDQESAITHGLISVESDIFGFGATFWECFAMYDICMDLLESPPVPTDDDEDVPEISSRTFFNDAIADLYENQIYQNYSIKYYCDRDFRGVDYAYHEEIEKVITKCTRRREYGFQKQQNPNDKYYHDYESLQKAIDKAKNTIPALDRKSDPFVGKAISGSGICAALAVLTGVLFIIVKMMAGYIADDKWNRLVQTYTPSQTQTLETVSNEMMSVSVGQEKYENFEKILHFTYGGSPNDNFINQEEAAILINIISTYMSGDEKTALYADEIMKKANSSNLDYIATKVFVTLTIPNETHSDGYELAGTIKHCIDFNDDDAEKMLEIYDTLLLYKDNPEYHTVTSAIAQKLLRGRRVDTIARQKNTDRQSITETLYQFS